MGRDFLKDRKQRVQVNRSSIGHIRIRIQGKNIDFYIVDVAFSIYLHLVLRRSVRFVVEAQFYKITIIVAALGQVEQVILPPKLCWELR